MTRREHIRGATLIELLIAVSLLSLLSLGMLMVIRVGFNAMERTNASMIANRRYAGVQRILRQQVSEMVPVLAECMGAAGQPTGKEVFFQGEPQTMRFVSTYSLREASRGYPRILEYQVIPGGEPGAVRLVVNEYWYGGPRSTGVLCLGRTPDPRSNMPVLQFRPVEAGSRSFVLADNLAYCRMSYRREAENPEQPAVWVPLWTDPERLPTAVRVEMEPTRLRATGAAPLSMTIPVPVDRYPKRIYRDKWESRLPWLTH